MLNIEELLIKIMHILDINMNEIKLKQTLEKTRFYSREESEEKYREHISLIIDKLNLNLKNEDVAEIFMDLIRLYIPIYQKLNMTKFIATEEKINWVILKRLVVPYLALRFSALDFDYDNRFDIGLSGGKFWYLPDVSNYSNVKLPMEYIMNWWLDLYGKNLESLCSEIDEKNTNEDKSFESINTIKQWIKKSIPDRKSIEEYCSIELNYSGVFEFDKNKTLDENFKNALNFIEKDKNLSVEELKKEIPYHSLVDKIFPIKDDNNINEDEKKDFIKFISQRWEKPSSKSLINYFIVARASQLIYKSLIRYFSFKESSDIEENKLLQLVNLYSYIYNENLQRLLHQTPKYDIEDLIFINYEYLDCFNTSFNTMIETISNDINIELSNQEYSKNQLEDIYQVKFQVYGSNEIIDRFEIAVIELKNHIEYFHQKFDYIEIEGDKYFQLETTSEKINFINNVDIFTLLVNIFDQEFRNRINKLTCDNYQLIEICLLQMKKITKTDDEKIQVLFSYLLLYTFLILKENENKMVESRDLLNEYESLVANIKEKHSELLKFKIWFFIKSKNFINALKYSNEYLNKYIKSRKKDEDSLEILILGAYSAYIQKDSKSLKEFNKYLKKYTNACFTSSQDLPYKIYFYKN